LLLKTAGEETLE